MLIDSFDKKNYPQTLSLEKRIDTETTDFKSFLQNNSESISNNNIPKTGLSSQKIDDNTRSARVHLGTLADDTSTVSELLYNTPYKKGCWEMLESNVNSSKCFKQIPAGSDIYLDKKTSEILWKKNNGNNDSSNSSSRIRDSGINDSGIKDSGIKDSGIKDSGINDTQTKSSETKDSVSDNTFNNNNVSYLRSKRFSKYARIRGYSDRNIGYSNDSESKLIKGYHGVITNAHDFPVRRVAFDPITKYDVGMAAVSGKISHSINHNFESTRNNSESIVRNSESIEHDSQSVFHYSKPKLNQAVKEFIGEDYSKIDCYELVVSGLKNMGVKYLGEGGLGRHLINKAIDEGLSSNHYLTGEGLVSATGNTVYNKKVLGVKNPLAQAGSAMEEMENVLKEGQILSFSTRTRGHTGVISKKDGTWTFINSGYMDNNIAGENGKKQVGEEILSKEIENWFKLAANKNDGLIITLGSIDRSKIAKYHDNKGGLFEKV